jgi:hypothetical protein
MGNWPTSLDDSTTIGAATKVNVVAITNATRQYDANHHNAMINSLIAMQTSLGIEGSAISGISTTTTTDTTAIRYRLEGRMISRYGSSEPATLQRILTAATLANSSSLLFEIGHTATTVDAFVQLFRINYSAANVRGYVPARYGGTDQTLYVVGDLLSADTTLTLSRVAAVATGSVLVSKGTGTLPAWESSISLTGSGTFTVNDATTNAATTILTLTHTTSGTAAAGIGSRLLFSAEDDAGATEHAASVVGYLSTVTSGAEVGALSIYTRTGGAALREVWRVEGSGDITTVLGNQKITYGSSYIQWHGSYLMLHFAGGQMALTATIAQFNVRPEPATTNTTDIGSTSQRWNGIYGVLGDLEVTDATTNNVTTLATLRHLTSGTAAAGIGARLVFATEDDGGSTQDAAHISGILTVVTAGAEHGAIPLSVVKAGTVTEIARVTSGGFQVSGGILDLDQSAGSGLRASHTTVADAAYTALSTDTVIVYTTLTAARTVTLMATSAIGAGFTLIVKDGANAAAANNITIDTPGAETIDGAASIAISTNYGYRILCFNGTNWNVIGSA